MRIPVFQIVQHLQPGGIETMVLDLLRHGPHENYVIALEGSREEALDNWPVLRPFAKRLLFMDKKPGLDPMLIWRLREIFVKRKPKAVHTHHIGPLLYGGLAANLAGVRRVVHTEHDAWHLENPKSLRLQKYLLRFVRPELVADAGTVANGLVRLARVKRPHVILNGIDTQRFSPGDKARARRELGLPLHVPLIGSAGRLEKVKGHENLLCALDGLPEHIHLAFAGDGSLNEMLRQISLKKGVSERVHFLGRVDDMPSFYRAIDVFCLPSLQEGMPLSPLEAQACGTPCVLSDVGGCSEALCAETGDLVPPDDIDGFAQALVKQLDYVEKNSLLHNPRNFVLKSCDARRMAQAYNRLYINAQP